MLIGSSLIADINAYQNPTHPAAFWWLAQHSFVLKFAKTICYIDAYLTPNPDRRLPPFLTPAEVTNADFIIGTHDHADHIDRDSWPAMAEASPKAKFIVPQLVRESVIGDLKIPAERVIGLDAGQKIRINDITITGVPAAHEFLDRHPTTGQYPYLGCIFEYANLCLYHAGDTCIYENIWSILRPWRVDLAFLPINGRDARRLAANCIGNMTYQEAADLAGALEFACTVPTHFDMFSMNSENPQLFLDYMRVKYPHLKTHLPHYAEATPIVGK